MNFASTQNEHVTSRQRFVGIELLRPTAEALKLVCKISVSAMFGPILGALADLGVRRHGQNEAPQDRRMVGFGLSCCQSRICVQECFQTLDVADRERCLCRMKSRIHNPGR